MNPNSNNPQELTTEEAKAALGLSTRLGEQFLMSQAEQEAMEAPQEAQEAPTEELGQEMASPPTMDTEAIVAQISASVKDTLTQQIKEAVKEEMGGLRKELTDALEQED